ncbi:MAG: RiPP maturation radical SAM C-methyltransferase, partial [Vicinamibacterales bacterium]
MDVVFVVMPFADVGRPAIGVSLLKAAAARAGYSATIVYPNIRLASELGVDLYQKLSSAFPPEALAGEWYFADDLFGSDIPDEDTYLGEILAKYATPDTIADVRRARRRRSVFLDQVVADTTALSPRIVGFTTTFHQTCGSVAIARRLKALPNPPIVVFGGANCEGEMGVQLLDSFSCIDYVSCGEADRSFVQLLDHLLKDGRAPSAGVLARANRSGTIASEAIQNLDELPYPDYDDYFEQLQQTGVGRDTAYHVIVETSRGCWWGAKHHCTFCGLNGDTMAFRSKSPDRAYDEITELCRRHGLARVGCVDNILDMRYIETLFPRLAASGLELELFYEVKSNLRRDQIEKMHRGGMRQIQPGIESFSNHVLQLMDKGVTGFQNIQLLRWCREVGIEVAWNILAGFPGESKDDYAVISALIPKLTHLDPPCSCAQLRLDRFSPFHARATQYGFKRVRPARAYFYVYPFGRLELGRLAYFFDYDYGDRRNPETYIESMQREVQRWWRTRTPEGRAQLDATFGDDGTICVTDTRAIARQR